jgi:hypothetical protein
MSNQADVRSIEALKEFRVALALFAEDALAALGGVDMEVRRTVQWVQHDRRAYWQEQIKRRREQVASAQAEVFRRKLAKTDDYTPAMSEQKELLRKAEASLRDAEYRAGLVKKWEPALQQAALEYHASSQRISGLAGGDVPRAIALLRRMIDALEAYLREAPPASAPRPDAGGPGPFGPIMEAVLAEDPEPEPEATAGTSTPEPGAVAPSPPEGSGPTEPPTGHDLT